MSFFRELVRRNVVKVAGLYFVAAWLLLQVTDVLSGLLPVPEWTGTLVFLLLLLGFPVVLIFSWVYEITPEGVQRDAGNSEMPAATATSPRRLDVLIIVLLVAVLAALVIDRLVLGSPEAESVTVIDEGERIETAELPPGDSTATKTIAVLPFLNMSKDPNEEYFSDGVSVQILNELSGVDGFKVTSQRSSFAFKDQSQSLQEIARLLDIRYVIDGSVFRDGDRIRITAQLVDAIEDQNIWTETYNELADDLFSIQDDIARSITGRLKLDGFSEAKASADDGNPSFDAYDLYLQARETHVKNGQFVQAASALDKVLEQEPNFVAALVLRANVEIYMSDIFFGSKLKPLTDVLPRVDRWLKSAEAIDPGAPDVLAGRGMYYEASISTSESPEGLSEEAERLYVAALRQRPNSTEIREHYARILGGSGRGAKAIEQLKVALEFDRANPGINSSLFNWSIMQHDLDLAVATLDRWKDLPPGNFTQKYQRARYFRFVGELAKSLRSIELLEATASPRRLEILAEPKGEVLLALGEYERAANMPGDNLKYRVRALTLQGRHGEAVLTAKRWLRQQPELIWPIDELLRALFYAKRWDEFVDVYEQNIEHWSVLRDYHYFPMDIMAYGPYLESGNSRVGEFQNRFEPFLRGELLSDTQKPEANMIAARLYTILGREDEAITELREAVSKFLYTPRIAIDPVFARLSGRSDYQELIDEIEDKINAERAELGLPPTKILRRVSDDDLDPGDLL